MQCANCRFENMPGIDHCGRCGASLRLATMTIDVHPPRASARRKQLRRHRLFRVAERLADSAVEARGEFYGRLGGGSFLGWRRFEGGALRRMLVPGWPQLYRGQGHRGRLFLSAYAGTLLAALATFGSPLGAFLLGAAVCIHASSIFDLLVETTVEGPRRWLYAIGCWLLVALLVYVPAGLVVSQVAVAQRVIQSVGVLRQGDVLLYRPNAYGSHPPQPGDVVVYRVPQGTVQARTNAGNPIMMRIDGRRIDRILAGPGQTVAHVDGRLLVDGIDVQVRPLNEDALSGRWEITVPPTSYLIWPSTDPNVDRIIAMDDAMRFSAVPRGNIEGRVYVRHHPFWRFRSF